MSCCGGSCGCGSGCKCGNGCGGCKMAPDFSFFGEKSTEAIVIGVVPMKRHIEEGFEMVYECDNGGCKCGPNCTCNPCTCK